MFQASPNTPVIQLHDEVLESHEVDLFIKRDDLIHPDVSGNKWRKLKYNLLAAKESGVQKIITMGGAYSNHIYSIAAACQKLGLEVLGLIRGDQNELNATLEFAASCGMQIKFILRDQYRQIREHPESVLKNYPDYSFIPEGGTNQLALKGVHEMVNEVSGFFDCWVVSCGTGGTMAGMVTALRGESHIIGFPALKGAGFLNNDIKKLIQQSQSDLYDNWELNLDFHFGGYAKISDQLIGFIRKFEQSQRILLDPVYTGKMIFGLYDCIQKGIFPKGSKIIAIHTGGLQGWAGMRERFGIDV